MGRGHLLSERVATPFGSLHVHVAFDEDGHPVEVSVSTPGKHKDSAVDDALGEVGRAVSRCIAIARAAQS